MYGHSRTVGDVTTWTVVSVGRDAGFREIVRTMRQWRIGALPVVEGEGLVVGVVSEADLLPKEEFRDSDPDRGTQLRRLPDLAKAGSVTAGELMTSPAVTVHADATLAEAARTMTTARVKQLPVVDDLGMLQGVISRSDLLSVFLRDENEIADEVRHEVLARLFTTLSDDDVRVEVRDGVVRLLGHIHDTALVPVAARMIRAVEGVVDVEFALDGNGHAQGVGAGADVSGVRPVPAGGQVRSTAA